MITIMNTIPSADHGCLKPRGKVCLRPGCGWSTKGDRTLFCGACQAPFPCALKRNGPSTIVRDVPKREAISQKENNSSLKKELLKEVPVDVPDVYLKEFGPEGSWFTPLSEKSSLAVLLQEWPMYPDIELPEKSSLAVLSEECSMYSDIELPEEDFSSDVWKFFDEWVV